MNILVVCELNFARSVITAYLLKRKSKKENLNLNIKSAGFFNRKIKRSLLEDIVYFSKNYLPFIPKKEINIEQTEWADKIVIMEEYMADILRDNYSVENGKIICPHISPKNSYSYNLIKRKVDQMNFY